MMGDLTRGRVAAAAVSLCLAATGVACGTSSATPPPPPPSTPAGAGASRTVHAPLLPSSPSALPVFHYATFQALLAQLRGRPVVVNIWGSWCGPCIAEAPTLVKVAREFAGRVQFLGVDLKDPIGLARNFIRRFGIPFPSVSDPTGEIQSGLGFIGQPITQVYLADGSKDRRGLWFSSLPENALLAELARLTAG